MVLLVKICGWEKCTKEFETQYPTAVYCSSTCKNTASSSRHRKRNPGYYSQFKKYGITYENFQKLLEEQNGVCAICEKPDPRIILSVDHNHITNKVRGLLCNQCNVGLGMLRDSIDLLQRAIDYLKEKDGS